MLQCICELSVQLTSVFRPSFPFLALNSTLPFLGCFSLPSLDLAVLLTRRELLEVEPNPQPHLLPP